MFWNRQLQSAHRSALYTYKKITLISMDMNIYNLSSAAEHALKTSQLPQFLSLGRM